jgi:hypothetical protein
MPMRGARLDGVAIHAMPCSALGTFFDEGRSSAFRLRPGPLSNASRDRSKPRLPIVLRSVPFLEAQSETEEAVFAIGALRQALTAIIGSIETPFAGNRKEAWEWPDQEPFSLGTRGSHRPYSWQNISDISFSQP